MQYRPLGRTGVQVSTLCLGCMNFGQAADEASSIAIINRAIDAGVNFIDTANVYGKGASETIVGKALQQNGKREKIILATKVSGPMDDEDINAVNSSRRHIVQQCEASLKRLQTDYIDLYQVHRACPHVATDETLRALDDLVHAGKVLYIGTSNHPTWAVVEALWISRELGLNRYISEQAPYHLLDRRIERELVPMAQTHGLAILCWAPLASGFLTGKYKRGQTPPEGTRLGESSKYSSTYKPKSGSGEKKRRRSHGGKPSRNLLSDATFNVVEKLQEIAKAKGCTASQLALSWVVTQPGVTSAILGPRTLEQLEDNLACLNVQVTEEDAAEFDEVNAPGMCVSRYYEGYFGRHQYRW